MVILNIVLTLINLLTIYFWWTRFKDEVPTAKLAMKRPSKKGKIHAVSDEMAYKIEQENKKNEGWQEWF